MPTKPQLFETVFQLKAVQDLFAQVLPAKATGLLHLQAFNVNAVELGLLRRGRNRSGLGRLLAILDVILGNILTCQIYQILWGILRKQRGLIKYLRLEDLQDDRSVGLIGQPWV